LTLFSSTCPGCGAPLTFRSAASTTAVCDFCKSTIARSADQLEKIGVQGDLIEDYSRIQIGSEGQYDHVKFSVVGRIQLRYEQGVWNEWYVLQNDGKTAWLSDASGQYSWSTPQTITTSLPEYDDIQIGQTVGFASKRFTATDKRISQCVAAQGELPFSADSRWTAKTIDFRSEQNFLTFDYSEAPPQVFAGQSVKFEHLQMVRLREVKDRFTGQAAVGTIATNTIQTLACKSCAKPLKIVPEQTQQIVCPQCGSELSQQAGQLLLEVERANKRAVHTSLEPGDSGKLQDVEWTVLGVIVKAVIEDTSVKWEEFLLFNAEQGLRWMSQASGAWQFIKVLNEQPELSGGRATVNLASYQLHERYKARSVYVAGAFNWKAKVGEIVEIAEYKARGQTLASERNETEQTWSLGSPLEGHQVLQAFGKTRKANKTFAGVPTIAADNQSGMHWLVIPSIVVSAAFVLITAPAWFMPSLDAPIEELIFGLMALWAPMWFIRQSGNDNDSDD
jgi:ribosomal protein L37AE/L43A